MALRQLGYYQEDDLDDYHRNRFHSSSNHGDNPAAIVNDVARRLAKAAFSSEESDFAFSDRIKDAGTGVWNFIKKAVENPGVKEGIIVASVMIFKIGLWYSYRAASKGNLEVIDL